VNQVRSTRQRYAVVVVGRHVVFFGKLNAQVQKGLQSTTGVQVHRLEPSRFQVRCVVMRAQRDMRENAKVARAAPQDCEEQVLFLLPLATPVHGSLVPVCGDDLKVLDVVGKQAEPPTQRAVAA